MKHMPVVVWIVPIESPVSHIEYMEVFDNRKDAREFAAFHNSKVFRFERSGN